MPLNIAALRTVVAKQAQPVLIRQIRPIVKLDFESKKEQFLQAFDNHPVSQEIKEGPDAFSRVQSVAAAGGNLFSLLGFWNHQDPIGSLREYLNDNIVLYKTGAGKLKGNKIIFETDVQGPTLDDINSVMANDQDGKLDWNKRGFTDLLETGISGLPRYLFDLTRDFSHIPSRSGPAIQAKGNLRQAAETTGKIPYMSELLRVLERTISPRK